MGTKNSKTVKTSVDTIDYVTDDADEQLGERASTLSTDMSRKSDLESGRKSNKSNHSRLSNLSNVSSKSHVSNKSQKKLTRKKSKELRKIRDKPDRLCRKASTAPDQAFIVEETLLEDLCAIAGEEAFGGGNIILSREKQELIQRLSVNQATADVFKNTTNIRKFSTNSLRGDTFTFSQTLDVNPRLSGSHPRVSGSLSQSSQPRVSNSGSSNVTSGPGATNRGSLLKHTGSILSNVGVEGVEDTVRLRRKSIKQVQTSSPKGAHELMTQANYRTEIQALKLAQKRETCSCARNCFVLCNIYI